MAKELYVIRLGSAVMLAPASQPAEAPMTEQQLKDVAAELSELVRASPIVAAEPEALLSGAGQTWDVPMLGAGGEWERRRAIQFADQIYFRAHWPRKNQEFFWEPYEGPVVEDFMILYDGFVYGVAARCSEALPRPYSFLFGREGRRIIETIVSGSRLFQMDTVGPTPMFPVIYVCFADAPEEWSLGRDLIQQGDTLESLEVFPRRAVRDRETAVRNILQSLVEPVYAHYEAVLQQSEFYEEQAAVYNAFHSASGCFRELARPAVWSARQWLPRLKRGREMRRAVGECYLRYAELEEERAATNRAVEYATEMFSRSRFLRPHSEYTSTVVRTALGWQGEHVLQAVRFLAEECRSRGLEAATWQGPLLAAAIAFAVTVATLWLAG